MWKAPGVETGSGPACGGSLGDVSRQDQRLEEGAAPKPSFLRLRRALVGAYVSSALYWPVTAADVRREVGGGGGGAGGLYCRDEGEESACVFLWEGAGDGLSLPARRGELAAVLSAVKDAPLLTLMFCSATPKMAATSFSPPMSLKWGASCSLWAGLGMQIKGVKPPECPLSRPEPVREGRVG